MEISLNLKRIFKPLILVIFYVCVVATGIASAKPSPSPQIWNVPAANDYFVGREKELKELETLLNKYHKLMVVGPGGIGKTQLAKKFAHQQYNNYQIIWWFDVTKNIDAQLNSLAYQLSETRIGTEINIGKLSASAVSLYVKEALRKTDKSWLIIFDNVKNIDLIKDYIPESHNKTKKEVLITSRNANEVLPALYLKRFTSAESLQFLSQSTGIKDDNNLNKLSKLLGFYPLALTQSAAYIRANNVQINEYISLLRQEPFKLWRHEKSLLESIGNYFDLNKSTMENTISLNLQNIKNESATALEIMEIMSFVNVPVVPEYLLLDFINIPSADFKTAIRVLKKHSLIEEEEKEGKKYYLAHDLVKQIAAQSLRGHKNYETIYKKLLKVMCQYLNQSWGTMVNFVNENTELINIANTIVLNAYEDKIVDQALVELTVSLLEHNNGIHHMKSNYIVYQALTERLHTMLNETKLRLSLELESRCYFGSVHGDFIFNSKEKTVKYKKKLVSLLNSLKVRPELIEQYFLSLVDMSIFCWFDGNIDQGIYYINKAYSLLRTIKNLQYQSHFWHYISWIYLEKDDYVKANEYNRIAFKITENNYPLYLHTMALRANISFHLGNVKDAYLWANESYKQSINFYQSENSTLAIGALMTLARTYKSDTNYNKAKELVFKAISIQNVIYDNKYIDISQARAHALLGEIYEQQKQYKLAYDEYIFAEKYFLKIHQMDGLSEAVDAAQIFADFVSLGIKLHDKTLIRRYFKKLVDNFTYSHPITKKMVEELSKHDMSL